MLRRSFFAGFSAFLILSAIPACNDATKPSVNAPASVPGAVGKDAPAGNVPKAKQI